MCLVSSIRTEDFILAESIPPLEKGARSEGLLRRGFIKTSLKNKMLKLGKYKHYKGKEYEVIGIARHSETLEELVVYKALYQKEGKNLWVRPLKMFIEDVEVKGMKMSRFEFIGR